jgi:diadenosine tetraphosphate (Ap4A) HIT family hydrolase
MQLLAENFMSSWPANYKERLSGLECNLCAEGRPEETDERIRFFSTDLCDAYLHFQGVQRGYATVIWRGGHIVEPTDLSENEAKTFWFDVLCVGRAMQTYYRPLKMNYQLLGNGVPHLHWLLAPRFIEDVAPGKPLPPFGYAAFPKDEVYRDVLELRALLSNYQANLT